MPSAPHDPFPGEDPLACTVCAPVKSKNGLPCGCSRVEVPALHGDGGRGYDTEGKGWCRIEYCPRSVDAATWQLAQAGRQAGCASLHLADGGRQPHEVALVNTVCVGTSTAHRHHTAPAAPRAGIAATWSRPHSCQAGQGGAIRGGRKGERSRGVKRRHQAQHAVTRSAQHHAGVIASRQGRRASAAAPKGAARRRGAAVKVIESPQPSSRASAAHCWARCAAAVKAIVLKDRSSPKTKEKKQRKGGGPAAASEAAEKQRARAARHPRAHHAAAAGTVQGAACERMQGHAPLAVCGGALRSCLVYTRFHSREGCCSW